MGSGLDTAAPARDLVDGYPRPMSARAPEPLPCQRRLFRLPADLHYLNCAYMSPLARPVEAAGLKGMARKRDPSRILPEHFFADAIPVRERFGRLVHGDAARVAIIPSVSFGIATVARNLAAELAPGRTIVVAAEQFPSNIYPWRRLAAETGAEIVTVAAPASERRSAAWSEALVGAIDAATAVVALAPLHWADGTVFDLEAVGERARAVGAALVVDGTQAVGAMPFDVGRLRPDALVCAAYKWLLGPYSTGLAWFGPRFDDGLPLDENWLARDGSEDFRGLVDYTDAYRPGAVRYDVGESANLVLLPMVGEALDLLLRWGVERIQATCRELVSPLVERGRERGWLGPSEPGAGHIVCLRLPADADPARLASALGRRRVAASFRGSALRVAPNVYNDEGDVAALLEALDEGLG